MFCFTARFQFSLSTLPPQFQTMIIKSSLSLYNHLKFNPFIILLVVISTLINYTMETWYTDSYLTTITARFYKLHNSFEPSQLSIKTCQLKIAYRQLLKSCNSWLLSEFESWSFIANAGILYPYERTFCRSSCDFGLKVVMCNLTSSCSTRKYQVFLPCYLSNIQPVVILCTVNM